MNFEVSSNKNGIFYLSEYFDRYWTVKVNGEVKDVLRCFGIYRGVGIEAGTNKLSFEYKPQSWYLGLKVSLITLIILFASIYSERLISYTLI